MATVNALITSPTPIVDTKIYADVAKTYTNTTGKYLLVMLQRVPENWGHSAALPVSGGGGPSFSVWLWNTLGQFTTFVLAPNATISIAQFYGVHIIAYSLSPEF